jgi:UDP-N-acetyl-D-mannosaminuronate dehydrogenase
VVLGFSYKENVGDPSESPAKNLIKNLKWKGANINVVDPYIKEINTLSSNFLKMISMIL